MMTKMDSIGMKFQTVAEETRTDPIPSDVRKVCEEFIQESGLHGVNKLLTSSSRTLFKRIIWGCALLACSIYLTYTIIMQLELYYSYPTSTSLNLRTFTKVNFPAVTICNMSPTNKSKINPDEKQDNFYMATSSLHEHAKDFDWNDSYYREHGFFDSHVNKSEDFMDDMVIQCMFDGNWIPCGKNLVPSMTSVGMCYVFNADGHLTTTMSGVEYNLMLKIFIDQENYYYSFTTGSGVKVIVHEPGIQPDACKEGFAIPPGFVALAVIEATKLEFLPKPFQSDTGEYCMETRRTDFFNPLKYHNYSVSSCMEECLLEEVTQRAGCGIIYYIGEEGRICSDFEIVEKYRPILLSFLHNATEMAKCKVKCPMPCSSSVFNTRVSYGQFPSDFTADKFRQFYPQRENSSNEYFRNNFLQLNLYYERLMITEIRQVPIYSSVEDILANLGGQMGLFLGASILTLTEIAELVLTLIICLVSKALNRRNTNTNKDA